MRKTILFGFLFVAAVISVGAQTPTGKASTGLLHGSVYDRNLAYIPSKILVECAGKKFEAEIGANAYYSLDLPSGVCSVGAKPRDVFSQSYYEARRANVVVKAGEEQTVNFYPPVRLELISTLVTEERPLGSSTRKPRPAYVAFQVSKDAPAEGLLQFSEREIEGAYLKYSDAVLSIGSTTVVANEMLVDFEFSIFKLNGNVIVDQDGKIARAHNGRIKSIKGELIISVN